MLDCNGMAYVVLKAGRLNAGLCFKHFSGIEGDTDTRSEQSL